MVDGVHDDEVVAFGYGVYVGAGVIVGSVGSPSPSDSSSSNVAMPSMTLSSDELPAVLLVLVGVTEAAMEHDGAGKTESNEVTHALKQLVIDKC